MCIIFFMKVWELFELEGALLIGLGIFSKTSFKIEGTFGNENFFSILKKYRNFDEEKRKNIFTSFQMPFKS